MSDADETKDPLRTEVERIAEDCELKGHAPPLDPDDEAEADQRLIYRTVWRRLRAALSAVSAPAPDWTMEQALDAIERENLAAGRPLEEEDYRRALEAAYRAGALSAVARLRSAPAPLIWYQRKTDGLWNAECACGATLCGFGGDATERALGEADHFARAAADRRDGHKHHACGPKQPDPALAAPPPDPQGSEEVVGLVKRLGKEWFDYGVACGRGNATLANPQAVESTLLRALRASVSGAPALAPWYEADGSTVMLPAAEVERRRRLAAKAIGTARNWREAMRGPKSERAARGLKERGTELLRALRALDAPAPGSDAGGGAPKVPCPECAGTGGCDQDQFCGGTGYVVPAAGEPSAGEGTRTRSGDGSGKGGGAE